MTRTKQGQVALVRANLKRNEGSFQAALFYPCAIVSAQRITIIQNVLYMWRDRYSSLNSSLNDPTFVKSGIERISRNSVRCPRYPSHLLHESVPESILLRSPSCLSLPLKSAHITLTSLWPTYLLPSKPPTSVFLSQPMPAIPYPSVPLIALPLLLHSPGLYYSQYE